MEPAPRVKKSGPESAPRRSPWSNPVISTPTTPTTPPRANPNALRKIKESEPKLKQNENSHPNPYNPQRMKTGVAPIVDTDKTAPYKNHNANYPSKPTPDTRVEPATRTMPIIPKKGPKS